MSPETGRDSRFLTAGRHRLGRGSEAGAAHRSHGYSSVNGIFADRHSEAGPEQSRYFTLTETYSSRHDHRIPALLFANKPGQCPYEHSLTRGMLQKVSWMPGICAPAAQPPAPPPHGRRPAAGTPELRQALRAIDQHVDDYINQARLGKPRENLTQTSRS